MERFGACKWQGKTCEGKDRRFKRSPVMAGRQYSRSSQAREDACKNPKKLHNATAGKGSRSHCATFALSHLATFFAEHAMAVDKRSSRNHFVASHLGEFPVVTWRLAQDSYCTVYHDLTLFVPRCPRAFRKYVALRLTRL